LGLLSEQPVKTAEGLEVVPLKVVKAVLPDPASLAPDYEGKTCIGDLVKGSRKGQVGEVFIYNVADHKEAYEEVGSQGISCAAGGGGGADRARGMGREAHGQCRGPAGAPLPGTAGRDGPADPGDRRQWGSPDLKVKVPRGRREGRGKPRPFPFPYDDPPSL